MHPSKANLTQPRGSPKIIQHINQVVQILSHTFLKVNIVFTVQCPLSSFLWTFETNIWIYVKIWKYLKQIKSQKCKRTGDIKTQVLIIFKRGSQNFQCVGILHYRSIFCQYNNLVFSNLCLHDPYIHVGNFHIHI